jgi:hypothetical protein
MVKDAHGLACIAIAACFAALSGCSLFHEKLSPSLKAEVAAGEGAKVPDAKYFVEIHPHDGKPKTVELQHTDQLHVQEALEKAGAAKKFRRMYVRMIRPLPSGGWHKMELEYDRANRRIAPEYDYAVLPGDRLMVIEDNSNTLTDLFDYSLKPFGLQSPRKKKGPDSKYEVRG